MQIQRYKIACVVNIQSCDVQYVEGLSIEIVYFLNGIFRDVSLRKNPRSIPLSIKGRFDNKQETNIETRQTTRTQSLNSMSFCPTVKQRGSSQLLVEMHAIFYLSVVATRQNE